MDTIQKWICLVGLFSLIATTSYSQDDEYIVKVIKEHKGPVVSVAFSPDGKYLVSGGSDKMLLIWDIANSDIAYKYTDNPYPPKSLIVTQQDHIFFGSGPDIKLVDLHNNTLAVYKGNSTYIWSVSYAPERNKIVAGSYNYEIRVWDVGTHQINLVLKGHKKSALPVAFSPDEKYIVSGSLDKTIKEWNAQTGECLKTLHGHGDNIYSIAFYPSGQYFASASRDKTVRLWDFESGKTIRIFAGHDKAVLDVAFTPDGNHMLSASLDGTIRLWETRTGKLVYTFAPHDGSINTIAISPDGKYLASGDDDGKVILWRLDPKIYVEYAYDDQFEADKSKSPLFDKRHKGEKKDEYEARMVKAKNLEDQLVEKYYKKYMDALKKVPITTK